MKHYSSLIHTVVLVLLVLAVGYLMLLQAGVITCMNPQKGQPKYSDNTGMSVILTFIGIVFALFAFLTFQSVKDLFYSKIAEVEKKQEQRDKEYINHVHKLENLENDILSISSTLMNDFASDLFKDGHNWLALYHAISAVLLYSKRKTLSEKDKVDKNNTVEGMLKTLLSRLPNKIEINTETHKQLEDISHKIISNTDMRTSTLLTKVIAKCEVIEKP